MPHLYRKAARAMMAVTGLLVLLLLVAACGSVSPNLASSSLVGAHAHKKKPASVVIKIGLNMPLSGSDASLGISAEDGALLAISQANAAKTLPGYTLQLLAKDDANTSGVPDATRAANNLQALLQDAQVAGAIGAFDTTTAEAELPLANNALLGLISPSATYTCLTQTSALANCGTLLGTLHPKGTTTFFRLAPTDLQQGTALANYASHVAALRTVYVIDDTSASGMGLASGFLNQFQTDGGIVLGHTSVGATPSYINLLTQIAAQRPNLVFYAGSDTEGISIRQQMSLIPGLARTPFWGGNGIHTTTFASTINLIPGPVLASSPSLSLTTGSFVQQYQAQYGALGTYSAAGYDSAELFIAAIKTALAKGMKPATSGNQATTASTFRLAVIQALAQEKLTSVTGAVQYTFNAGGDPVNNIVEIDTLTVPSQWVNTVREAVM